MRNLKRNTQIVYFKTFVGTTPNTNADGFLTGEETITYSELKTCDLCVSSNRGSNDANMFGTLEEYDRIATTSDVTCELDENSIVWIEADPNNSTHDYIVKRRAPWKNSIAFALSRVKVSDGNKV